MKKTVLFLLVGSVIVTSAFVTADVGRYFEIIKNLEIFNNAFKEVNTHYVDELEPGKLMKTGLDAMLNTLDPYTNYLTEAETEGYRFLSEGHYFGVGATYKKVGDYITVTDLYENAPAQKSGVKIGDVIINVEGKSVKGKTLEDLEAIVKGSPGSVINLTILRNGKEMPIALKRDEVEVQNVPHFDMVADGIGYVVLTTFTAAAADNIKKAIKDLRTKNPNLKGVIIDLRGNGGGLLHEAVQICNLFVPRGEVIVSTRGKIQEQDFVYKTSNEPIEVALPVAVLIDSKSASASEIVSGALQDHDRAVLIGQRSYGKGLVQNIKDIGYGARVKVTTSRYYIPSGRCIQAVQYKDGLPVDVPESQRAVFKTKNGRKVLDGGGVKPDVVMPKPQHDALMKALEEQSMIFDFVTEWAADKATIPAVMDFHFTEFDKFEKFLQAKKFAFTTPSETALKTLKEQLEKEKSNTTAADIAAIEAKIKDAKRLQLSQNKDAILNAIEQDIVGRYYFHKGRIQLGLRNDAEVKEAISILNDTKRYQKLLNK